MIKGIIFDFGGTIDTDGIHWEKLLKKTILDLGVIIDDSTFHHIYVEAEKRLERNLIIDSSDTLQTTLYKKIEIELSILDKITNSNHNNKTTIENIVRKLYTFVRSRIEQNYETLQQLKKDYPLALVTNYYGNIESILKEFNLSDHFSVIIESQRVGIRKPDPTIFQMAIDKLNLRPSEVLVIGDSYQNDILPAQFCGCKTLWLTQETNPEPEIIKTLQTVRKIISCINLDRRKKSIESTH